LRTLPQTHAVQPCPSHPPPALDLDGYQESLFRCRDRFPDLEILSGVELSEPYWHPDQAADLLRRGGFDLVVCGLHSLCHGLDAFGPTVIDHAGAGDVLIRASRSYRGVGEVLAVHVRGGCRAQECPGL
jgi:histidinol phosphatase-like PHP family hydrolase